MNYAGVRDRRGTAVAPEECQQCHRARPRKDTLRNLSSEADAAARSSSLEAKVAKRSISSAQTSKVSRFRAEAAGNRTKPTSDTGTAMLPCWYCVATHCTTKAQTSFILICCRLGPPCGAAAVESPSWPRSALLRRVARPGRRRTLSDGPSGRCRFPPGPAIGTRPNLQETRSRTPGPGLLRRPGGGHRSHPSPVALCRALNPQVRRNNQRTRLAPRLVAPRPPPSRPSLGNRPDFSN